MTPDDILYKQIEMAEEALRDLVEYVQQSTIHLDLLCESKNLKEKADYMKLGFNDEETAYIVACSLIDKVNLDDDEILHMLSRRVRDQIYVEQGFGNLFLYSHFAGCIELGKVFNLGNNYLELPKKIIRLFSDGPLPTVIAVCLGLDYFDMANDILIYCTEHGTYHNMSKFLKVGEKIKYRRGPYFTDDGNFRFDKNEVTSKLSYDLRFGGSSLDSDKVQKIREILRTREYNANKYVEEPKEDDDEAIKNLLLSVCI